MQDKLKQLLEPTPKSEIKFRMGGKRGANKAFMLAYVDARYVMDKLDTIFGHEGWRDEYKEVKGNLYCGISIKIDDEWITKWDCGVESNIEQQKGEASDSFKRSAVKWGIGRDLYSMGNFTAPLNEKGYPPFNWKPSGWEDDLGFENPNDELAPHRRALKRQVKEIEDNLYYFTEELKIDGYAVEISKAKKKLEDAKDNKLDKAVADNIIEWLKSRITEYEIKEREAQLG